MSKWSSLQKWLEPTVSSAAAFFLPIKSLLSLTGLLIAIDFITGVMAARRRGEAIQSAKMKQTAVKALTYQMAIITAFIIEQKFIPELPIVRLVSAVIGMTELKSVMENLESFSGIDFLAVLAKKLGGDLRDKSKRTSRRKPRARR